MGTGFSMYGYAALTTRVARRCAVPCMVTVRVLGLRQAGRYHHDTVPPAACMMPGRACQQSCEPIQHTACAEAADQWYVGPTDVLRGPAIKEQPESIAMRQQPPHWLSAPGSEQEGWIRYSKEIGFCTSVL